MDVKVECQKRAEGSKPGALRRSGLIPAVLYGHNGTESVSLTMKAKEAETLLKKATVNNTPIQFNVPELPWSGQVLLREVQSHPWKKEVYHLSFFSVAGHGSIEMVMPLHFEGTAAGVKEGGVLDTVMTELKVQCIPDQIPEAINVDISNLGVGDSLRIEQLPLPKGITPLHNPEETVVTVTAPLTATEETQEALEEATETPTESEAESEAESETEG